MSILYSPASVKTLYYSPVSPAQAQRFCSIHQTHMAARVRCRMLCKWRCQNRPALHTTSSENLGVLHTQQASSALRCIFVWVGFLRSIWKRQGLSRLCNLSILDYWLPPPDVLIESLLGVIVNTGVIPLIASCPDSPLDIFAHSAPVFSGNTNFIHTSPLQAVFSLFAQSSAITSYAIPGI